MKYQPPFPLLKSICEPNELHVPNVSWTEIFANVYEGGYGFPRRNRWDADRYASSRTPVLYRIRVRLK